MYGGDKAKAQATRIDERSWSPERGSKGGMGIEGVNAEQISGSWSTVFVLENVLSRQNHAQRQ